MNNLNFPTIIASTLIFIGLGLSQDVGSTPLQSGVSPKNEVSINSINIEAPIKSQDTQSATYKNQTNQENSKLFELNISDYTQLITSLISFFTLLFLIWQSVLLRRQTASLEQNVRSQTYQDIVSNYCEINKSLVSDDKLAATFESLGSSDTKSKEIERRKRWLTFWLLNHYENAYVQYKLGALPSAFWAGIESDCIEQIQKPYVAKIWKDCKAMFSKEFMEFIESRVN